MGATKGTTGLIDDYDGGGSGLGRVDGATNRDGEEMISQGLWSEFGTEEGGESSDHWGVLGASER